MELGSPGLNTILPYSGCMNLVKLITFLRLRPSLLNGDKNIYPTSILVSTGGRKKHTVVLLLVSGTVSCKEQKPVRAASLKRRLMKGEKELGWSPVITKCGWVSWKGRRAVGRRDQVCFFSFSRVVQSPFSVYLQIPTFFSSLCRFPFLFLLSIGVVITDFPE